VRDALVIDASPTGSPGRLITGAEDGRVSLWNLTENLEVSQSQLLGDPRERTNISSRSVQAKSSRSGQGPSKSYKTPRVEKGGWGKEAADSFCPY